MTEQEYWYRYEDVVYAAPLDEYDRPSGSRRLSVELRKYAVVKHTPCGVRLDLGCFVSKTSRKRFAHATLEEARESFIARKERQASIHQLRVDRAENAIRIIKGDLF